MNALWKRSLLLVLFSGIAFSAGCGGEEWDRVKMYGDVTYGGEDVEVGTIMFTPTGDTQGPAGIAEIHNGHYSTDEKGAVPGKQIVSVEGFDGQATEDSPMGSLLFRWETEVEVPDKGSHEFNITVPGSASPTMGGGSDEGIDIDVNAGGDYGGV
jgi:hypothetical protein